MQSGYIAALFAKEQRTPVEKSPKAWSKGMLKAFWNDKNYLKYTITQMLLTLFLGTPMWQFINIYGLKDLKMIPATSAVMLLAMAVWTGLTGARTSIIPIKICPIVKTVVALLFVWASLLSTRQQTQERA